METKSIIKLCVATLSVLYVVVSLILDVQAILPNWPWQYHALAGFVVYVIVTVWTIYDLQVQISSSRPYLKIADKTRVIRVINEADSELNIKIELFFENSGQKPAYQLRICMGYADLDNPSQFQTMPEITSVNRIDTGDKVQYGVTQNFRQKYQVKDQALVAGSKGFLLYCKVFYSGSETNGKHYNDEFWFAYDIDSTGLKVMSIEDKKKLEPYVRQTYGSME